MRLPVVVGATADSFLEVHKGVCESPLCVKGSYSEGGVHARKDGVKGMRNEGYSVHPCECG